MKNNNWAMALYGKVRTTVIVAITLSIFVIAIISVSNPSMFVAAKGGTPPYEGLPYESVVTDLAIRGGNSGGPVIPSSTSCSAGGFGAGCSGASGVTSGGTLSQLIALSPVSYDVNPTDNSLNYVSNSMSYGGGKISVNLPRFDREASYFRIVAPCQPIGLVPVKMDGPLLLKEGSVYSTGNNLYGQISQNEALQSSQPYQNLVTRHGVVEKTGNGGNGGESSGTDSAKPGGNSGHAIKTTGFVIPPSMNAVILPGSEIYSIGDPGDMDPDSFRGISFGHCLYEPQTDIQVMTPGMGPVSYDAKPTYNQISQNEEALFQENLKETLIHRAL